MTLMTVRVKRAIARAFFAVSLLVLAAEVVLFTIHRHHPALAVSTVACTLTGILCGLAYLRSTRGRS